MADPQASPLPVFYRNPVPLDRVRHAKLGFVRPKDHGFARGVNSVPIAAIEFQSAARNYPIVFTNTEPAGAVAVLGFEAGQNLFLDGNDRWADDCYVPAYVRRYPFVFTRTPAGEFVLCMEEAPGLLAEGGEAIFGADGKPSKMIEEVLRFAGDFQLQIDVVQHFVRACIAAGVLVENRASIQMPDKRAVTLQGFRTIDTKRFEALPEATVAEWWRKGWLMLAYQHLMSLGNWQLLANRASKIANAAKAAKG